MNALKSLTIVAGLLAAAPAFAAEGAAAESDNPTGAGAGALVFSLTNIISTPSAMDGVGVGGVYFFNQKMAVRAGLGFLKSSTENDPAGPGNTSETSGLGVGLEGGIEYVLMSNKSVNIWGGGLLQIGYQSSETKDVKEESSTSLALAGALGADWFFADHMSLGAEYRLGVQSNSSTTKPEGGKEDKASSLNIGVGSAAMRLGFWF